MGSTDLPPGMIVQLQFKTYEEPLTLAKRVEAKAVDPKSEIPVVSLPLSEMARWLEDHGFRWRTASNGIWERNAA